MNKNEIIIWGSGSSGKRYAKIVESFGFKSVILSRDSSGNQFDVSKLELENVFAGIISTPTIFHAEQSVELLKKQIPVLCDKPIASNFKDGNNILKIALENNTKFHVGYNQRFFKSFNIFKDNEFGIPLKARSVWAEDIRKWQKNKNFIDSYAVRKDLGGGVPLTLSHDFDWWLGIFPDLKLTKLTKSTSSKFELDIETYFKIELNGKVDCQIELDYFPNQNFREYEVTYETGVLTYRPFENYLKFMSNDSEVINIDIGNSWIENRQKSFISTFKYFIEDQRYPSELNSWEFGLDALKIACEVESTNE